MLLRRFRIIRRSRVFASANPRSAELTSSTRPTEPCKSCAGDEAPCCSVSLPLTSDVVWLRPHLIEKLLFHDPAACDGIESRFLHLYPLTLHRAIFGCDVILEEDNKTV